MESIILTLCGLIVFLTITVSLRSLLVQHRISWLAPSPIQPGQTFPVLSVIIPARNEARDIVETLHSVLHQQGIELEVIVVNDHSTDQTGILADEIARGDSRVMVLHNPPMQSGWLGKVNAMQYGLTRATGDYLVFTDADILHTPTCFATALTVMRQHKYDFFSFSPLWINKSVWEHLNLPIYLVGFIKFMSLSGVDDPDSSNAVASGAFMMLKKSVLQEIGGLDCVKGAMFDDVELARSLKTRRYRVSYWFGPECARVRLFKTAHEAFWGTTKNILGAVDGKAVLALPLILFAVLQYWTSLLAVVVGSLTASPLLLACGVGTYVIQYFSFFFIRRLFKFHPLKLVGFPFVVIVSTCCIIQAVFYRMKGAIFWRGRAIRVK